MCGIAGISRQDELGVSLDQLGRMAAAIRHRGPDGYGFYTGPRVGLAHVRLSIIDIASGAQPMTNEAGDVIVTFNGEIFNYRELMAELKGKGHQFRTSSDTEVLVHGWEEWGAGLLDRLNGQWAFGLYDGRTQRLILARDRFGVRPLFYAVNGGTLVFASEVKALFASGLVVAAPDPVGLDQVFTFWAARPPRTPFLGVSQLEPGCYAVWENGRLRSHTVFTPSYSEDSVEDPRALEQLDELLTSSTALRLRADVPVGAYLSGGLDSSITARLAAEASPFTLHSFSITFEDPAYDEAGFQNEVAAALGTRHTVRHIRSEDIAAAFPDVIRHTETPLLRTAPVPMYHLARATAEAGIKVVLTGEGADELFLGYDLFKEVQVRLFCLRQPNSRRRPRLFDRLYPWMSAAGRGGEVWRRSFLDASPPDDPLFSHMPRFRAASWVKQFYGDGMAEPLRGVDALAELRDIMPAEHTSWTPFGRAAYLEILTLLSPYLLSSQTDRVGMAHAVESRYPFLDPRLFRFAASLPTSSKLRGLSEKRILKRWARGRIPDSVTARTKQPYRAPDAPPFTSAGAPAWVADLVEESAVARSGFFNPAAVGRLMTRCRQHQGGPREHQALVAILSTELWYRTFCLTASAVTALPESGADVVLSSAPQPTAA
ncbi:MAG: asparagine synthase (glutamine-hydrolyzing) [Gemmatimonadota bacterium]